MLNVGAMATEEMTSFDPTKNANEALQKARDALSELDANCCVPGRSPRMAALGVALDEVDDDLASLDRMEGTIDPLIDRLEAIGAQVGSLQIDCCAPSRMPLYSEMLVSLNKIQKSVRLATKQSMH